MTTLPLEDITVLDLTIARAGPTAVRLLADWGANVIKVEPPPVKSGSITGGRHGPDEQNLHRNKRGLCINLKHDEGHALFVELVKRADVVVENFRAPVKHRLRVDYETLVKYNERLIYASISGFGQDGPYSDRPGVDQIVQGMSGLMSITGHPGGGPVRAGIAISDTTAGMFLGQGILLALIHRERTGKGQWVHTSLLEGMLCKLDFQGARFTMLGDVPKQQGNNHPTNFPMGTFQCQDGYVNIAAPTERMWVSFLDAIEDTVLRNDARFRTPRDRIKNRDALEEAINEALNSFSVDTLVEKLNANGVPCGPILDVGEGFTNPQAKHLKMARSAPHKELGDVSLIRSPINMSAYPHAETFDRAAPNPGEHTREVLAEFGIEPDRIDALYDAGTIG